MPLVPSETFRRTLSNPPICPPFNHHTFSAPFLSCKLTADGYWWVLVGTGGYWSTSNSGGSCSLKRSSISRCHSFPTYSISCRTSCEMLRNSVIRRPSMVMEALWSGVKVIPSISSCLNLNLIFLARVFADSLRSLLFRETTCSVSKASYKIRCRSSAGRPSRLARRHARVKLPDGLVSHG
jgi:hypothetical protein